MAGFQKWRLVPLVLSICTCLSFNLQRFGNVISLSKLKRSSVSGDQSPSRAKLHSFLTMRHGDNDSKDSYECTTSLPGSTLISPARVGSSSIQTSTLNLAKTIVGAGMLSLPSGVALVSNTPSALLPASILLVVMGVVSAYTFSSIGAACHVHNVTTFPAAWTKSTHTSSSWISSVVVLKTLFSCLAFSAIIGEYLVYMCSCLFECILVCIYWYL